MKMQNIVRATIGQVVTADVTGVDNWLVGEIIGFNKTHITFKPFDGSEDVTMARDLVFKVGPKDAKAIKEMNAKKAVDVKEPKKTKKTKEIKEVVEVAEVKEPKEVAASDARVTIAPVKTRYTKCRAASGRSSLDNDDQVAQQLRGATLDHVYNVAARVLGVDEAVLVAKYGHLNPGQQRMCLGNRIRGATGANVKRCDVKLDK